jgi:hypothetical protein
LQEKRESEVVDALRTEIMQEQAGEFAGISLGKLHPEIGTVSS